MIKFSPYSSASLIILFFFTFLSSISLINNNLSPSELTSSLYSSLSSNISSPLLSISTSISTPISSTLSPTFTSTTSTESPITSLLQDSFNKPNKFFSFTSTPSITSTSTPSPSSTTSSSALSSSTSSFKTSFTLKSPHLSSSKVFFSRFPKFGSRIIRNPSSSSFSSTSSSSTSTTSTTATTIGSTTTTSSTSILLSSNLLLNITEDQQNIINNQIENLLKYPSSNLLSTSYVLPYYVATEFSSTYFGGKSYEESIKNSLLWREFSNKLIKKIDKKIEEIKKRDNKKDLMNEDKLVEIEKLIEINEEFDPREQEQEDEEEEDLKLIDSTLIELIYELLNSKVVYSYKNPDKNQKYNMMISIKNLTLLLKDPKFEEDLNLKNKLINLALPRAILYVLEKTFQDSQKQAETYLILKNNENNINNKKKYEYFLSNLNLLIDIEEFSSNILKVFLTSSIFLNIFQYKNEQNDQIGFNFSSILSNYYPFFISNIYLLNISSPITFLIHSFIYPLLSLKVKSKFYFLGKISYDSFCSSHDVSSSIQVSSSTFSSLFSSSIVNEIVADQSTLNTLEKNIGLSSLKFNNIIEH